MSLYLSFVLSFGALLALMAVTAAWVLRTSAAPLWAKLIVPALTVLAACYAPLAVATMLGFPVVVSQSQLPDRAQLLAFVPHDDTGVVDLWLRSVNDGYEPRVYETALTPGLKKTLEAAAREAMARGQIAMLVKRGHGKSGTSAAQKLGAARAGDRLGIGDDQDLYELDPSALGALPPK